MKNNIIGGIVAVVIIIAAVIGVIGFTSSNNSINTNSTYNDGSVMFSYPSNMTQPTYNATNNTNSSNVWNYTSLTDNSTNILLGKTSKIPSPLLSSMLMSSYLQSGYGQIVSNLTASTNPNGVIVYRFTYESNYTNVNYYYMDFASKDNSTVYDLSVYGNDSTQSQNVANQIFNSLKLS
ncbi:MAG: hypothetical protein ABSE83_09040 [Methanobacterium sp.]|jgi:hypothetical protein